MERGAGGIDVEIIDFIEIAPGVRQAVDHLEHLGEIVARQVRVDHLDALLGHACKSRTQTVQTVSNVAVVLYVGLRRQKFGYPVNVAILQDGVHKVCDQRLVLSGLIQIGYLSWTIGLSMTSCCCLPFAIPLLIFWIQAPTKDYFCS